MKKTSSYKEALFESLRSDPEEAQAYLNAAYEDSPESFLKALGNVAQANQMSKVAKETGVQRESLYRSLSEHGNPTFHTLFSVLRALSIPVRFSKNNDVPDEGGSGKRSNGDIFPSYNFSSVKEGQSLQSFAGRCMSGQKPGDDIGSITNGQHINVFAIHTASAMNQELSLVH